MKPVHNPLTKEQYNSIKAGDVIERMLAFCIPNYFIVESVDDKYIHAGGLGWKFDKNTGIEVDEDISVPVSYISKILTEEQKLIIKNGGKL